MELRNPFGLLNGVIVMIEDISPDNNGLKCGCVCPACNEPFEARMGEIRRHHFAHSGKGCDEINAYMVGLYMVLCEYLRSNREIYIPPVIALFDLSPYHCINETNIYDSVRLISQSIDENREEIVTKPMKIVFDDCGIESDSNGKPLAILARKSNRTLAIVLTPPDTVCKIGEVKKYKNYPTLEMNLSACGEMIQGSGKEILFEYLTEQTSLISWVYNEKITEAFPKIIKRSKAYYEKSQKRLEEERKRRLIEQEQRRKEQEERWKRVAKEAEEKRKRADQLKLQKKDEEKRKDQERKTNGYEDVKELFIQNVSQIRDRYGIRWIKCERCGYIDTEDGFVSYGGINRINSGICRSCAKRDRK